ncbi:MAG: glycosyltransferase [Rubrivivax sp.]|nr:MAG: glycosyltransferase [Rubrivivax sp.]
MHILLVHKAPIPVYGYGGTERVIWDLGRALVGLGHRVSYLVPAGSHCDFAAVLPLDEGRPWQTQVPADVDLVHFQFDPGESPDTPYLVTEHGNSKESRPFPLNTVFVSADHAARYGSSQFVLNGLDWDAYGPVDWQRPRQRHHFLGKAAWRVKNVQGAIDVALGAGVELDVLGGTRLNLKRGFRFTLSPRVHFHGMVGGATKLALLNASHGLILPVRWHEPFGLAVIESLYFGCPVFATPYGALPELVGPAHGVLSNRRAELSEAVRTARFDARACHEHARSGFSVLLMAQDYVVKYQRVLDGETLNPTPPRMQGAFDGLPWIAD